MAKKKKEKTFLDTQNTDADFVKWCKDLERQALEELGDEEGLKELDEEEKKLKKLDNGQE